MRASHGGAVASPVVAGMRWESAPSTALLRQAKERRPGRDGATAFIKRSYAASVTPEAASGGAASVAARIENDATGHGTCSAGSPASSA